MLQFNSLSLRRGAKSLFTHACFQVHPGWKVGLTGANGCGKSSLFALILDQLHADSGDCLHPANWVIAHVAQETAATVQPAIEFILDGDKELRNIEAALQSAEQESNGLHHASLFNQYENIDGYRARSRAGQLLSGLGFKAGDENRAVNEFSGGWRMRLNLAQALMCRSDLLLLDEPTNHLDLETLIWLESWLKKYTGTLLMISHDRDFLDSVCDHIAHIEHQHITLYNGNYSAFEHIRAERLANQQASYIRQQREREHIQSYISRFRAQATKAKQAQSRLKALQRMAEIAPAHVDSPFHFSLPAPDKIPDTLLRLEQVCAAYGTTHILQNIDLVLHPGDRIGLLGPNGAGKSTLIKILAAKLAISQGERQTGRETRIGYFAQHQIEHLHPEHTPLEHLLQIDPKAREADCRNFLGGFGFSNDMAISPVAPFSGGEKSRLALALLVYQRPNLLLLDEPTNHLDLEMRQALAQALQDFAGAMVIVSHDRHLLRVSCDRLLLVHNKTVDDFPLSLDDYPKWLSEQYKQASPVHTDPLQAGAVTELSSRTGTTPEQPDNNPSASARKERKRLEAEQRKKVQPLRKKITRTEQKMETLQQKQREIETLLADTTIYAEENKQRLQQYLHEKTNVDKQFEVAENDWLQYSEEMENLINMNTSQ